MSRISRYKKFIDIEDVIKSKSEFLLKITPKIIIRWIRRVLHEEDLNSAIKNNIDKHGHDFAQAICDEFGAKLFIKGELPKALNERFIMVSNHPLGGLDGLALIATIGKIRKDLKFIVNDLFLFVENLKNVFLPVNKIGSSPKEALRIINNAYQSNELLLTFPFGLVSRRKKGIIQDLEWKKSFITKAKQTSRHIIPIHINGRNSNFFYNLSNLRRFLKIKINIEMFFLVNEMYKQKDQNITITFGKPIPISTFDNTYSETEWAEKLRKFVYDLAIDPGKSFQA